MSRLVDPEAVYFSDRGYDRWAKEQKVLRNKQTLISATKAVAPKIQQVKNRLSKAVTPTAKSFLSNVSFGNVLSYSAAFVGTNMLFPGSFWQNAASSVAWETARIATRSAGAKGWKQYGAAMGASVATNLLWHGAKSTVSDVAVKEATGGMQFSGFDDVHNTIEGLSDSGMKQEMRHALTEFGSGYQGPNPWLNPAYNQAEDIERYKMMRASKLGSTEEELYEYYTKEEEPSEFLASTANAGTALHLIEEAVAVKQGRVLAAEEMVYDPQTMVSGHIDVTYKSGAPADIKTLSARRFEQVKREGAFEKHVHQLNWYMHQKNTDKGYLEYVNRDDTSQRTTVEIDYNPAMYEQDMQKVMRVRRRVEKEIEAGILNEALLPKTASLETLKAAAANEAGETAENIKRLPYLREVYKQEMQYMNKVAARRKPYKKLQAAKDKEAQGGQRISGKDDNYNIIEGLRHGGMAEWIRKALTSFGSGWDPMKALAKQVFKNADDSVSQLKGSLAFKEALAGGKEIKQLGEGLYGSATLMEAEIEGNVFQYVKKDINSSIAEKFAGFGDDLAPSVGKRQEALKSEYAALGKMSDRISPSPYMFDQKSSSLYMEYMPGKTLNNMENVPESIINKIKEESIVAGQRGVFNPDIHRGNILYDETSDRVSWLDFGLAKTSDRPITTGQLNTMESAIAEKISTPISIQPSVVSAPQEEGFFDSWGTVMSAKGSMGASKETMNFDSELVSSRIGSLGLRPAVERSAKTPKPFVGSNIPGAPDITGRQNPISEIAQSRNIMMNKSPAPGMGIIEEVTREKASYSMLADNRTEAPLPTSMPAQISKTVGVDSPPSSAMKPASFNLSDKARIKRIKKFRQVSTDAVGIGHRAAYNAGHKHSGFSSTKPTNGV